MRYLEVLFGIRIVSFCNKYITPMTKILTPSR